MNAQSSRSFVADTALVTRRIADETILVPISSRVGDLDSIYTLTEIGSRIWSLLQQAPVSLDQIVAVVCAEYDVTADVASNDAAAFIDSLVSKKLAHPVAERGE
jgi:hypothetical protein